MRATGLAVELAHKLAKERGCGSVSWEDLQVVHLSGDTLFVNDSDKWRKARSVDLQLQERDCLFALEVFRAQRELLCNLGLNLWAVDKPMGRQLGSHDLVAEYSQPNSLVLGFAYLLAWALCC